VKTLVLTTICGTPANATTYTYDQAGQLTSYADTDDATGLRKTQGTQTNPNTWDRSSPIAQLLSDNTNAYIYGPDGLPLEAIGPNATTTIYHHDTQGSTRAITNTNGAAQATYTYDPYGTLNANIKTAATTNPFLYAGQYTDPTGLQYLRARYYDPTTTQFITRDPIEAFTRDAYGYAGNDPVNNFDPSGLDFLGLGHFVEQHGSAISAATGTLAVAVSFTPLAPAAPFLGLISAGTGGLSAVHAYNEGDYLGMTIDGAGAILGGASVFRATSSLVQSFGLGALRDEAAGIANVPSLEELGRLPGLNSRVQALLDSRRANAAFGERYDPVAAGLADASWLRSLLC
jgi:RHS repeat-associated protein